ncbi:ribosome biogenesis GTP-binding protein YsxC [Colletotrichum falcatum]|nr:ribosome biogenesis GTP-binding protein YsxC [Colletotrichum falcatum]
MFRNVCRCRAIVQRQCLPTQRWLSATPSRTYIPRPQPDADGWFDGRRHPSRYAEPGFERSKPREGYGKRDERTSSYRGATDRFSPGGHRAAPRDDRGRGGKFSSPSRMDAPPRGRPARPKTQAPKRKGGGFVLMPKLSQDELEKISTAKDVWEARSLYYVPPKRAKEHQQPVCVPKPAQPASSQRNRSTGIASASEIKAAIKGVPQAPNPSPLPEIEGDGGFIVASHGRDVPHAQAARFFLSPPAKFLYSAFRLKHHPINTTTPEICVVGASNCGKSSFINALTNSASLAKVSDRAGKTVSMNAYGVGSIAGLPPRAPVAAEGGGATKEALPEHGLVLVDTPGYGYASHEEWGREIVEYLNKRTMLRGVVLLLSSEKKVSEKDAQIVRLLADAGRPVMIVFTKMDKALLRRAREEGGIAERLREAERCFARAGWDGWVRKVHITAARMVRDKAWKVDGTGSAAGMAGVRMGVLELAGIRKFVAPERARAPSPKTETEAGGQEKKLKPGKALESDPAAWSGDVISFEELEKKFGDWSS